MRSRPSTCACLATLYLALDEMRTADDASFMTGLSLLRDTVQKATTVLDCQTCPSRMVWAMQNAQLLNTLILSIAEAYHRIVSSIESETHRAESMNESKALWFGEVQSNGLGNENGAGLNGAPSFTLNLSPSEWQKLSKKAVKAEIYGTPQSSTKPFFSLLQSMEDRQFGWHSTMPPVNFRCQAPGMRHDGEPLCVMLVRQARALITRLPLED